MFLKKLVDWIYYTYVILRLSTLILPYLDIVKNLSPLFYYIFYKNMFVLYYVSSN